MVKKEYFNANSVENFFVNKRRKTTYSGYIFRTHSYLNLLDLKWINDNRDSSELNIMLETILSTFAGHNLFSIFLDKVEVFEQVNKQYNDSLINQDLNQTAKEISINNSNLLLGILNMPVLSNVIPRSDDPNYNCDECINHIKRRSVGTTDQYSHSKNVFCDCRSF